MVSIKGGCKLLYLRCTPSSGHLSPWPSLRQEACLVPHARRVPLEGVLWRLQTALEGTLSGASSVWGGTSPFRRQEWAAACIKCCVSSHSHLSYFKPSMLREQSASTPLSAKSCNASRQQRSGVEAPTHIENSLGKTRHRGGCSR